MRGLHRLLHHRQQVLAQLLQVHFLAQGGTEGSHHLRCIILAPVETAINDLLDAPAQRLEQPVDRQRGDDDGHVAVMADDTTQKRGEANHQAYVDPRQDDRESYKEQRENEVGINRNRVNGTLTIKRQGI